MHDHPSGTRSTTLHARIRSDVEARILSGEWKPGDRLPTETDLMARYGCSRMTVNKAMTSLAATGLISRNRRAGTVVARPRMHAAVLNIPDIRADIEARGARYGYRAMLDERRPPAASIWGPKGTIWGKAVSFAPYTWQTAVRS